MSSFHLPGTGNASPSRDTGGRQTLGSKHDAPGASNPAREEIGALQRIDDDRPLWWYAFKDKSAAFNADRRRVAEQLIQHVDIAWAHMAEIRLACVRHRVAVRDLGAERVSHLLTFIERDVVESFAEFVERAVELVDVSLETTTDAVCASAQGFGRALCVAALASEAAPVPPGLRGVVLPIAAALVDWAPEFCSLLPALSKTAVDLPPKPR